MKRDVKCPDCDGSGRNPAVIARSEAWRDPVTGREDAAYEGPAQCGRCGGTGGLPSRQSVPVLRVPADHPRAAEIAAMLEENPQ